MKINFTGTTSNTGKMETTIMDLINRMRHESYANIGRFPDNVMIHPSQKQRINNEAKQIMGFVVPTGKAQKIFGMKVIWTREIDKDVCICTFNGNKPIKYP